MDGDWESMTTRKLMEPVRFISGRWIKKYDKERQREVSLFIAVKNKEIAVWNKEIGVPNSRIEVPNLELEGTNFNDRDQNLEYDVLNYKSGVMNIKHGVPNLDAREKSSKGGCEWRNQYLLIRCSQTAAVCLGLMGGCEFLEIISRRYHTFGNTSHNRSFPFPFSTPNTPDNFWYNNKNTICRLSSSKERTYAASAACLIKFIMGSLQCLAWLFDPDNHGCLYKQRLSTCSLSECSQHTIPPYWAKTNRAAPTLTYALVRT